MVNHMKHVIKGDADSIEKAIDQCVVGSKAYRNREVLKSRYVDGYTFEDIAGLYGKSDRQIKRICYKYEPIIISKLRAED